MIAHRRFELAGVTVLLRVDGAPGLDDLAEGFAACPEASGTPDLVLEVHRDAAFAAGRPRSARYPAFERTLQPDGTIALSRTDIELILTCYPDRGPQGERVRATARASDQPASLDAALRAAYSVIAPRCGALILHASAVIADGQAHVLSAVSGTGKSTLARLLAAQPGFHRLADELVILRRHAAPGAPARWWCHPVPFRGCEGDPFHPPTPLASLNLLSQSPAHARTLLESTAALKPLLRNVVAHVAEAATAARVLELGALATHEVPTYHLAFAPDPSVATVFAVT